MHIMNRYGDNVSSCRAPATMSKKSVSPSCEQTLTFVFLYSIIMAVTVSLGDHKLEVFAPSSLCMESNVFKRSTNERVALRFFAQVLSINL